MVDKLIAPQRAQMPKGTSSVLDRRSLERDNKNLLPLLGKGMTVLDVGCGSGAITMGIANKIGKDGSVLGIDASSELISLAREKYDDIENLSFHVADIMNFETDLRFDLITAARTLQWLNEPEKALAKMKSLLAENGCITILDYNHEKIEWQPSTPQSMQYFYTAFLQWRQDAGMSNRIADDLESMFYQTGFSNISVTDESELSRYDDMDFLETAGIWKKVAETRGHQLVNDGYVTELERLAAIDDYQQWLTGITSQAESNASMKMYLLSVTGYNS
jgi:ubiquinone/menaquinone biosynthesis C-methylase UbiE